MLDNVIYQNYKKQLAVPTSYGPNRLSIIRCWSLDLIPQCFVQLLKLVDCTSSKLYNLRGRTYTDLQNSAVDCEEGIFTH
uniref:AlNc14C107G6267 protein n=1 Tax=Albugo laibachii Nc14 TaxID=890382 RepID=F0WI60_9STRA|nr:AlNc14C107G6267 [Albugo laibachii Nc14]|eukprot:CCA20938.1 AlNc14C107G6267 [Albugo laibachii Nc14]